MTELSINVQSSYCEFTFEMRKMLMDTMLRMELDMLLGYLLHGQHLIAHALEVLHISACIFNRKLLS